MGALQAQPSLNDPAPMKRKKLTRTRVCNLCPLYKQNKKIYPIQMSSNIYIEGEFHPRRICRMGDHNYTPLRICNKICKFNFPVACFSGTALNSFNEGQKICTQVSK